jgi:hypothetical protein
MLQVFGFQRIGVVLGDLYFIDPSPAKGQEGPEHGVRLEVRMLQPGELTGSIYSSRPITVAEPVWRADLLESVDGPPGSFDRTHHHPNVHGWEPGRRVFERGLSADPVGWVGTKLADLEGLLAQAGVELDRARGGAGRVRPARPDQGRRAGHRTRRSRPRQRPGQLAVASRGASSRRTVPDVFGAALGAGRRTGG